ncbi:alpha-beta hydrolase superfamily lysophospholipase [Saccharothrix ecbatanensis]|uniref:Alpha-beta hydrolase superfamily lysophospholipase n=1 Tax=Saccharothrix ecbatanensis TaxID=1105145 RepID=A0A7W9HSX1_9PSEU|nr:alpha/beta fold hydrolase [Saccharothrix ecbatanensis]MBB5807561.1 alpha-beta hydrolase superfamily lysophospholipase [Saccharothrix ecbatanensis]
MGSPNVRRRRRLRVALVSLAVVLLLISGGLLGFGWYYSGELLEPENARPGYRDTVTSSASGSVALVESRVTVLPGTWGLVWPGGGAKVGQVTGRSAGTVVRELEGAAPPDGTLVRMETAVWTTDPAEAHDLEYTEVRIPTELGDAPAWLVPATSSTWVVAVHGRGGSRAEALRVMPALHELGLPVLAITYRNDEGAPASPDGLYHLGDTEWRDVEAAVKYAERRGARNVVLYGWSMGGAIVGQFLARSAEAVDVAAVVLDAPVVSWTKTLEMQSGNRGVPEQLVPIAELVSDWRVDLEFSRFDLAAHPPAHRPPTLLFHGGADGTVPVQPSRDLAAAAGRLDWPLRYVEVPAAEHTAAWNVDPEAYERTVSDFLDSVAGVR